MRTTALIRATGLTAVLGSLAFAVPAPAAVTIVGNNLQGTPFPNLGVCNASTNTTCTVVPVSLAPERLAPANRLTAVPGVVVRWELKAASAQPTSIALRVMRGNTPGARSPYRSLAAAPSPQPGIFRFDENPGIPVGEGDRLGVDVIVQAGAANPQIAAAGQAAASWHRWEPGFGFGPPARPETQPYELLLRAYIEPDVDLDSLGDDSQDTCVPGGTQAGCPVLIVDPPPTTPPPPPPPATTPPPPPADASTPLVITPAPSGGPAPSAPDDSIAPPTSFNAAPRITALQFNATRISFRISEPASVSLLVQRVLPGKRVGARCVKPTRRTRAARKCNRLVRSVAGRTDVDSGLNTARLRRLPTGRYRVRLLSIDLSGRTSTIIKYFRVRG